MKKLAAGVLCLLSGALTAVGAAAGKFEKSP
jgi:hypothetical protein